MGLRFLNIKLCKLRNREVKEGGNHDPDMISAILDISENHIEQIFWTSLKDRVQLKYAHEWSYFLVEVND